MKQIRLIEWEHSIFHLMKILSPLHEWNIHHFYTATMPSISWIKYLHAVQ